jgi:hypothetical protein
MYRRANIFRLLSVGAMLCAVAGHTEAAALLKPALLIKLYKEECVTNMRSLKAQLADGKILIRGSKKLAASSSQLQCNTDAKNPTIRQMNNKAWLEKTEKFILSAGVNAYAVGSRKSMAVTLERFKVVQILSQASAKGLSPAEIKLLGNMTRAVAFTEAHVRAAQRLYKKK